MSVTEVPHVSHTDLCAAGGLRARGVAARAPQARARAQLRAPHLHTRVLTHTDAIMIITHTWPYFFIMSILTAIFEQVN